ncbi:hypothetical protein, partial [Corallococcus exercitus]|uniref:hypothetical protein n=1 Tax=Corallococcus exercitus TaxID=2316736 RepID=UPI001ABF5063
PSRCAFQRCSQGEDALKKLTAGFRNPLLLGLAIWFSKTEPLVATLLLAGFFPTGGVAASISVRSQRQLRFCVLRAASKFVGAVQ